MPGWDFIIFLFFLLFFRNFLTRVKYGQNSGLIFFFLFFGLSHPVLVINNAGKWFYSFLNFITTFSEFSCPGRVWMEFGTKIFFLSFSAYLIQIWLKIMQERCILLFWIFLLFFSEFSCLGHVWTEFVLKMFFTLSRPTSSSFGKKYCREEV